MLKDWCFWIIRVLEKTLESPVDSKEITPVILKEISPEYSLEGLMLKFPYFGTWCKELTHWKRPWCWAKLKAGVEGDERGWDGWVASLTQWTCIWASSFNFMAAVIICSDFGDPQNKVSHLFPHIFATKWWDKMPWSQFSECWVVSQLFHSLLFHFHQEAL